MQYAVLVIENWGKLVQLNENKEKKYKLIHINFLRSGKHVKIFLLEATSSTWTYCSLCIK